MSREPQSLGESGQRRWRITYVVPDLSLGATGKGAVSFSTRLDRDRFAPKVVGLIAGGPRERDLRNAGVPCVIAPGERLADELAGADLVHVFRHGIADPTVPAAAARAGVTTLIETNIFGARDRSADERRFACHLLVSMMCLVRYRTGVCRGGGALSEGFDERHRVLYFPPESGALRAVAPDHKSACRALGLDPARPVVGRLGRAADLKWRDLLIDMVPHLLERVADAQILFVGTTAAKRNRLRRLGVADAVRLLDPVSELDALATLYSACDVVVNASMIGESQGLVIAEAFSLGIPVVTCSTPWVDNAQIEFVRNGETGWVANHPREFADAVADLLRDSGRRNAFGAAGRALVEDLLDPVVLTRQLEELYLHHLDGAPVHWRPSADAVDRFADEYASRTRMSFRPLDARERLEARVARERETFERHAASVRMVLTPWLERARFAR